MDEPTEPFAGAASALPRRDERRRPCRLCGYHAPSDAGCPHCDHAPRERSLRWPPPGPAAELWIGLSALPRGAGFLLADPKALLWIAVPIGLTLVAFAGATVWLVGALGAAADATVPADVAFDESVPEWLAALLEWPVRAGLAGIAAEAVAVVVALATAALAFWFAFSIVFEAVAGPFLDEIHGRTEARWFGEDPRSRLERPTGATTRSVTRQSAIALPLGLLAVVLCWPLVTGWTALVALPAAALAPATLLGLARPAYGRWLLWVADVELRALRASLLGLGITGAVLVAALPLLLVPLVGTYLYGVAAGFGTSLGLLDIPFSRRGLDLADRLAFVRQHALATTTYGVVSGLLFGIPFLGPLLVVPSASLGGLWLFCRLDKRALRGAGREAPPAAG